MLVAMPTENTLLLIYFLAYFLLAFAWRSVLTYRRTGINPVVLPRSEDAYGYVGLAFKVVILGCAMLVSSMALLPDAIIPWTGRIEPLQVTAAKWLGWFLLLLALLWMLVAQAQMGASWRIGIDTGHRTELVSSGLFAISRNPIFLAMRASMLGLFLVAPNAVTLALLVTSEVLLQVQVRLEEAHLSALHGSAYDAYCAKVRRWL